MRKFVLRHWRGNGQIIADIMRDTYRDYPKKSMNRNACTHTLAECIVQVISEDEFLENMLLISIKAHNDAVRKHKLGDWKLIKSATELKEE